MHSPETVWLVLCNCPDETLAKQLAQTVISEHLAACVNLLPACESIYRWQDAIESSREIPLLIKTTAARYPELQARLHELHPYEVPEIIAIPLSAGLPAYLDWVHTCKP
ncbi:divalent-cation tolerance protein CutA [Chitinilyticum piscinae]|uniref:Divalent-cation tolerance protein CutA n=1 Tax=Chitinilyticum piscinae TaxID=2866724 RepID=A0A8J7K2D5_9NEIS|nr:divalent-cation tolerance protein CutA [Chitinilyticum piscinae]MBE9609892.1 divalent-cation tolerance protein CutA [Chitinilyticum piscinae]